MERLQKVIASAGIASRRGAEDFVRAGRVSVNGRVIRTLGTRVDPTRDEVRVDGHRVEPLAERIFILLHKPEGYLTTRNDPQGRPTVLQLLPSCLRWVCPVGRLDLLSGGLLLFTNDGEMAQVLTHPRYQVRKVYQVWPRYPVTEQQQQRLLEGVRLSDGVARVLQLRVLPGKTGVPGLEMVLTDGRKREIRRMLKALGNRVQRLVRVQMGPLRLGKLAPGRWRFLHPEEVAKLDRLRQEKIGIGTHPGEF